MKLKNKYIINGYKLPDYFIDFLKSQNILNKYIDNFNVDFGFFESQMYEADLINSAFEWSETKEGRDFWVRIHYKWAAVAKRSKDNMNY